MFRYIWEFSVDGSFLILEDIENEFLGRGIDIWIYLKENVVEYVVEGKLWVFMF